MKLFSPVTAWRNNCVNSYTAKEGWKQQEDAMKGKRETKLSELTCVFLFTTGT